MLASVLSNAETNSASGKIDRIYTYNNGQVLFTGFSFSGASCSNNGGFFIAGNHPHLEKYMSLLLAAKAMQSTVVVVAKVDNCWYPEITQSGETTYFYIE